MAFITGSDGNCISVLGQEQGGRGRSLPPRLVGKDSVRGRFGVDAGSYGSSSTLAWKIPWMEEPGGL